MDEARTGLTSIARQSLGANLGAARANDFPARRTSADKRPATFPGGGLIWTALNAVQVTTDQKAVLRTERTSRSTRAIRRRWRCEGSIKAGWSLPVCKVKQR